MIASVERSRVRRIAVLIEVGGAAKWQATRGLKGLFGQPLPDGLSTRAFHWIRDHGEKFQAMVQVAARMREEAE